MTARLLRRPFNIDVAHKPMHKLNSYFTKHKDKTTTTETKNAIYIYICIYIYIYIYIYILYINGRGQRGMGGQKLYAHFYTKGHEGLRDLEV